MEKVSILIPTVGRPTLKRALDSLIAQTYSNWEAIVVLNQTSTPPVLPNDPRIVLVVAPDIAKDTGASARNLGFGSSTGLFISTLDDDDWWEPTFLEEMTKALKDSGADLIYCRTTLRNREDGSAYGTWLYEFNPDVLPKAGYILSPSILCRRAMLEGYQFHANEKGRNSDWIFYIERYRAGFKFASVDLTLANLSVNDGIWRYWAPGGFRGPTPVSSGDTELPLPSSSAGDSPADEGDGPVVIRQRRRGPRERRVGI